MEPPRLRRSDDAVAEVVGFIMMFAISAMILVFTMQAFDTTRKRTRRASAEVQLQAIADQVATRVVQAGMVGAQYPNATFNVTTRLPDHIEGFRYKVTGTNNTVYVNSTNEMVTRNSTTFETGAISGIWVHGTVYSGPWDLVVHYEEKPSRSTATKDVTLTTG